MSEKTKSLALEFIDSYNRIDKALREIYNLKPSFSFSDVVRRAALMSSVVKKYEDTLIDYGRLRNAIVHRATDQPIAEPHEDVVDNIRHIERLITTPPLAIQTVGNRSVTVASATTTVGELIKDMFKTGYSNIPVYLEKVLIGVVNRKMLVDSIGRQISGGESVDELLSKKVIDALQVNAVTSHYEVVSHTATIDQVLFMFQQNRRLSTIIITKDGNYTEKPLGIIATADVIDMQNILEKY